MERRGGESNFTSEKPEEQVTSVGMKSDRHVSNNKHCDPSLIMKKHQADSSRGAACRIRGQGSSKLSRLSHTEKV